MKAFLTFLQFIPAIISTIHAVEQNFNLPQSGKAKLDAVTGVMVAAHAVATDLPKEVTPESIAKLTQGVANVYVAGANAAGVFKK